MPCALATTHPQLLAALVHTTTCTIARAEAAGLVDGAIAIEGAGWEARVPRVRVPRERVPSVRERTRVLARAHTHARSTRACMVAHPLLGDL